MSQRTYSRYIHVTDQFEGYHKYENAPSDVAFLKNLHRHIFHLKCTIEVYHNERELEFIMVKHKLEREILPYIRLAGDLGSCETMAERIIEGLINTYGDGRFYAVEVWEDQENGATIEYVS